MGEGLCETVAEVEMASRFGKRPGDYPRSEGIAAVVSIPESG
jgi:hypothetical protein